MSDVNLQDWPEGVRLRITYWHNEEEPGRWAITSYAGKWRFFEPVSVEIEPHPEGFYVPARDYDRQAAKIALLRARVAALEGALGDTIRLFAAERDALQKRVATLTRLVEIMIENDPDDMAADAVTVLDVWRKEARAALGEKDE